MFNRKIIFSFACVMALSISPAIGGSGTRGGGHVMEVNGKLELVDVVTNATCDWFSGQEIMNEVPYLQEMLKRVDRLDWYLALELKREIEYISWCKTGKLYSVPAADDDSFVQQIEKGVQQAAFRYNSAAYLDSEIFNQLSERSKAYLVLHETLHSYLPMHLEMRQFKLMSLVSTFRKVDLGQIGTLSRLHLNLEKNEMDFPLSVQKLTPYKQGLEFALSSLEERVEMILSKQQPEEYLDQRMLQILPNLSAWDIELAEDYKKRFTEALSAVFANGNWNEIHYVLNQQKFKEINPAGVALNGFFNLAPQIQDQVVQSAHYANIATEGIAFLGQINLQIKDGRIVGDLALQSLSNEPNRAWPQTTSSLTPSKVLPFEAQMMVDMIVALAKIDRFDEVERMFGKDSGFKSSLELQNAFSKLEELAPPMAREKRWAKKSLEQVRRAVIVNFKERLRTLLMNSQYEKVMEIINL